MVGVLTREVIGDRREEKSEEKRNQKRSQKRREDSSRRWVATTPMVRVVSDTTPILLTQPRTGKWSCVCPKRWTFDPDRLREDIQTHLGAVALSAVDLGQEEQRRFEPPNRANPKWPRHGLLLPRRQPPRAAVHVAGHGTTRRRQGVAKSTYPGLAQRRQRAGIRMPTGFNFEKKTPGLKSPDRQLPPGRAQFELDLFGAELPANNDLDYQTRLPVGGYVSDPIQSPGVVLIDTVAWRCYDRNPCEIRLG